MRTRKKQYEERLHTMLHYVEELNTCRSQLIANYFGDTSTEPCGNCDNCLQSKKKPLTAAGFEEIKTQLLGILQKGPIQYSSLSGLLKNKKEIQVLEVLEDLQAEEIVQVKKDGTITLR